MSSSSSSSSASSSASSSPRSSPEPTVTKKPSSTTESKKRKAEQPEIEVDLALPEPPSKKAKRALKKGKPLPVKKDSDDEANQDGEAKASEETKPKKKERSPYGIWIGNLRFTVTRDELRRWLVDNSGGAITDDLITRVHLPPPKLKKRGPDEPFENRGFAHVDFATYEANVAAIALSETEWYRRRVLIKDATSFEGRPEEHVKRAAGAGTGKNELEEVEEEAPLSTSQKIFVGNLGFQTTEDDVRDLFARCGEIAWAKIATFEDSGKCKGYGWVKFVEPGAAESAVKGFVKIKEVEETEEDFMEVDEKEDTNKNADSTSSSDSDEEEATEKKPKAKPTPSKKQPVPAQKVKMRKWWVNTLHGRRLKIEHAEDDETRYKKRFKGKGPRQQGQRPPPAEHRFGKRGQRADNGGDDDGEGKQAPTQATNFREDINVARLTGAAVKPQGKKTTFE